jgi:hypothetical protein
MTTIHAKLSEKLIEFTENADIKGKGPLSVVLTLNRRMFSCRFPLRERDFITSKGGQVLGLGKAAVQSILKDHGIQQILAKEGGRTSRGSLDIMKKYVHFVNGLHDEGLWDGQWVENWWISQIRRHFNAEPIRLKIDSAKSLRAIVGDLMDVAYKRQKERPGTMVAGAILQHLVGAKLRVALPAENIPCHGFSVADAPGGRDGDFTLGDTAIHVTTAPTDGLLHKCQDNLNKGLHPLIITTSEGIGGARALSKSLGIEDRVDVLDIEQFIATNVFEWTSFHALSRASSFDSLLESYNQIVQECETDTSLCIVRG